MGILHKVRSRQMMITQGTCNRLQPLDAMLWLTTTTGVRTEYSVLHTVVVLASGGAGGKTITDNR